MYKEIDGKHKTRKKNDNNFLHGFIMARKVKEFSLFLN